MRFGSHYAIPATRTFAELLIDCQEDRTLRGMLVGMLEGACWRKGSPGGRPLFLREEDQPVQLKR